MTLSHLEIPLVTPTPTTGRPYHHAKTPKQKRKKPLILDIAEAKIYRFLLRLYVLGTLLATITLYSRDDIFCLRFLCHFLPLLSPGHLFPSSPHIMHRPIQTSLASMTRYPQSFNRLS